MRTFVRTVAGLFALGCVGIAAYLAFDWADYGTDSTCGNFARYKGAGAPCSDIIRHRAIAVAILVVIAIALVLVAAPRRKRTLQSS